MLKVFGQFVDEARTAELAQPPRRVEIGFPKTFAVRWTEAGEKVRIGLGPDRRRKALRDDPEIGQLGRRLDLGVAGEDLFDQGRSRTGQADHEYCVRVSATAAARFKKGLGEQSLGTAREGCGQFRVVGLFSALNGC